MDIEQPSVRRRQAPAGGPQGSNAGPQAGAAATARGQELTLSTQESRFDPFDSDALANLGIPYLGFMASDQPAGLRATVSGGLQSAGNAHRRHRPSSAAGRAAHEEVDDALGFRSVMRLARREGIRRGGWCGACGVGRAGAEHRTKRDGAEADAALLEEPAAYPSLAG